MKVADCKHIIDLLERLKLTVTGRMRDECDALIAELREMEWYVGKTVAAVEKGAVGTVEVYTEDEQPTGRLIYPTNQYARVESHKWVCVERHGVDHYIVAAEC